MMCRYLRSAREIMTCLCSKLQRNKLIDLSLKRKSSTFIHQGIKERERRVKTANDIKDILEPLFYNGLQNYSSDENKLIVENVAKKYDVEPKKIKKWIDYRKGVEKKRNNQLSVQCLKSLGIADTKGLKSPVDVTPLKLSRWEYYLKDCPLPDAKWVLDGIENGFALKSHSETLVSAKQNLQSAYDQDEVVSKYLADEIKSGYISGPYISPPFENLHVSRIGVIPKAKGKDEWRLITDLSFPKGASVNDGISIEDSTVTYNGLTSAISKILLLGRGTLLSKFDLKNAYRLLPVREDDRHLLGLKWNRFYFVDLALPFGLRSAPQTFSRFAHVLQWIFQNYGFINEIQHTLDDYLICEPSDFIHQRTPTLERVFKLCDDLGIQIKHEKTQGPSTQLLYLGFELDTEKMEVRIPSGRLEELRVLFDLWKAKNTCTKRELLSLIGTLYYCSVTVLHGRSLVNELVKTAHSYRYLGDRIELSDKEKAIISEWNHLLNVWNGRSILSEYDKNEMVLKWSSF